MNRALFVFALLPVLACSGDAGPGPAAKPGATPPAATASVSPKATPDLPPPPPPSAAAKPAPSVPPGKAAEDAALAIDKAQAKAMAESLAKAGATPPTPAPTGPPRAAPRIVFDKREMDFGTKLEGDLCEIDFPFENVGDAPLIISKAQPSCGCTVPHIMLGGARADDGSAAAETRYEFGKPIPVGGTGKIHVAFNLKGVHGAKVSQVSVFTNDPSGPATLRVQANVEPYFVLEPQHLNLGEISKKEGKSGSIKISTTRVPAFKITGWDPLQPGITVKVEELPNEGKPAAQMSATIGEGANEGTFSSRVALHTDVGRTIDVYVSGMVYGPLEIKPGPYLMFGLIQKGTKTPRKIEAIARDPAQPIRVTKAEIEATEGGNQSPKNLSEFFQVDLRAVEDGKKYEVEVVALETLPDGVFRGTVRLYTDHPEVQKKEIVLSGFVR